MGFNPVDLAFGNMDALRSGNERLRVENAKLQDENAKLRELVRDALTTISWCTIDCGPSDNKKRELNARAFELGIEVNE